MEVRVLVERSLRTVLALLLLAAVHGPAAAAVSAQDEAPTAARNGAPTAAQDEAPTAARNGAPTVAQDEAPTVGWTNETELSLALTGGNSAARTFGFGDTLRRVGESSRLQIRASGIRSGTAGDRFLLVDPGLRFPLAGALDDPATRLVRPEADAEVENYLVSGRYETDLGERFFWNAGGGWDRNSDAGILDRYTAFAGVGNVWRDSPAGRFATSYAASYTNRREEIEDPGKDPRFAGARLGWDYRQRFGEAAVYENELTANVNLTAASDYSFNMTHALSVALSTRLALRVGLQWLYEHRPASEETAVVARVEVVDPDGAPGTGDELFETVTVGGAAIVLGTRRVLKDRLDTIFRTALVISF